MLHYDRFAGGIILILLCFAFDSKAQSANLKWEQTANGVWKAKAGKPEAVNYLSAAGVSPKLEAINALAAVPFPLDAAEIRSEVYDGKTYLRFPLDKAEKIYGLGLHFKTVEQRGRILRLHVDHYNGSDNGRTHAPVPFYVSSKGYGVFINSARYVDVWAGTGVRVDSKHPPASTDRNTDPGWSANPYSDNMEVLIPAEGAEIYVFGGESMLDVVSRFNLFQGGGTLPPRWGLGFWHRTPTLFTDRDLLNEVKGFEEHRFPLTVIGLEPGWQSKSYPCTYEWDGRRFPDPQGLIRTLKGKGIRTNLWINPYVAPGSRLLDSLKPFTATHSVWTGYIPDYSMKAARDVIRRHFQKTLLDIGVSGFKMDENDGYDEWLWPDVTRFPSGIPAETMRQTYGVLMQKEFSEWYRMSNTRTYGLVRASNAGATSFPFVIYNDYYSHKDFITALINSSFIGTLWTPEVRSSATAEEWLRRMQTVCFSPLAMLNAWADGTKPWTFPEVERQVTEVANLRMQLIPYFYTCFAEYAFYGRPPFRAMQLTEGFVPEEKTEAGTLHSADNPYAVARKREIKDQFMVGDQLLIAPMFTGETKREVVLPKGKWYDFYTGKQVGESEVITITPGLDRIPVFVRDGGIIPMYAEASVPTGKGQLIIRHYGEKEGVYRLYDDDGETYDYQKGSYSWRTITVKRNKKGEWEGQLAPAEKGKPDNIGSLRWVFYK